jgi:hypothetical protein
MHVSHIHTYLHEQVYIYNRICIHIMDITWIHVRHTLGTPWKATYEMYVDAHMHTHKHTHMYVYVYVYVYIYIIYVIHMLYYIHYICYVILHILYMLYICYITYIIYVMLYYIYYICYTYVILHIFNIISLNMVASSSKKKIYLASSSKCFFTTWTWRALISENFFSCAGVVMLTKDAQVCDDYWTY